MEARILVAIAVFVLGTMYLWSSPAFVKPTDVRPGAPAWSERFFVPAQPENVWNQGLLRTALLVVLLFGLAAFGIWRAAGPWWTWVGLAGAILGLIVLVPWWVAVGPKAPAVSMVVNAILVLWAITIAVVVLAPGLRAQLVRLGGGA